jgi:CheY-like chemotaxis protein
VSKRALVIEDNEQNLYLMQFLLTRHGFDVDLARTGSDGVARAQANEPDIILLDIQLPEMNGYEVARAIRKDHALLAVPIVAVTSYAMPGDREQVLAAGCTGYIEKPINPDTFVRQLEAFLARGTGEAPEG